MKQALFSGLVLLMACSGKSDNQAADTTATAAASPAALTVNDLAGTYNGTDLAETTDSVIGTWTSRVTLNASGSPEGLFVSAAAPKDTVAFIQTISGDSVISESVNYTDSMMPKGTGQIHWRAVGRRTSPHEWAGTVAVMPVGKDTVLARGRWKATHTP